MVLGAQAVQNRTSFITLVATLWHVLLHIVAKHYFVCLLPVCYTILPELDFLGNQEDN